MALCPTRPRAIQARAPARLTKPKTLRAAFHPIASDMGAATKVERAMARVMEAWLSPFTRGQLAGAEPVHEERAKSGKENGDGSAKEDPGGDEDGVVRRREG